MIPETASGGEAREFPATRWTAILAARDDDAARRRALEDLIAAYWKPLYFYVRRKGLRVEEAKDAVQEFLVHVLEKDFLGRADPQRGRFRGYLKASFDHFLVNRH
ncbi:MAG: sigma-70 family RNA polymerase sigma factor, partial [Planctomycetota bacterium]